MSFRFHHLHIVCRDLEPMIRFFSQSLGAGLVRRQKFGTADGACMDLQGTTVNLRGPRVDEKRAADASAPGYGYDHLGLEVEDLEAAYAALSAQGFAFFMPPTDIPGLRIAFFKGPEGIVIELVQKPRPA
jgi:catechol 2,3-dioxygenase-like lactoylglutathione lyase family enzyme